MRNIKLEIEYDGTNYAGWQIQNRPQKRGQIPFPDSHLVRKKVSDPFFQGTIQETIENILQGVLQEKVRLIASGRTDSGVHALSQTANFRTASRIGVLKLQNALNSLLPDDISIRKMRELDPDFHSRYRAKAKTYRYIISISRFPSAFLNKFSWHIPYKLDINLMRQEARCLIGRHDFKSFCASGSRVKTTIRDIREIAINAKARCRLLAVNCKLITIEIEANGFLYNMARNIVGTLVEVGRERLGRGSLKRILLAKDRRLAGPTAPANGLFLLKVRY